MGLSGDGLFVGAVGVCCGWVLAVLDGSMGRKLVVVGCFAVRLCQFALQLVLAASDHFDEVGIGQPDLFLIFEHQKKPVLDGIFIASFDDLGHLAPFFAELEEQARK